MPCLHLRYETGTRASRSRNEQANAYQSDQWQALCHIEASIYLQALPCASSATAASDCGVNAHLD